ncbi:DUF2076 domain-containing protein [Paramagnetospirillum kuznetsovii]|uniref:DUF2076 domain-containing protein n=1 Tax=Paramagnetospirillum kuznetsovii TaxID=2053833 RepID=A0A364NYI4_9PROT|nr:DUF2076 domain-containing protein [Paramagnetospirillum kuznetsovii]RAU22132.1 DUF2076 domain-containing protein [Paramagnetospirillum kuznetsovii]
MTPQDRDLILSVFDRLSRIAGGQKDREAEALIADRMRAVPDAAYNLVEAVVVQENAIKDRDARIAELERQLAGAPQSGGFAQQAANPWGRGSVPSVPQQQQQQQYAPPPQYAPPQYAQPQQQSPWGQPSGGGSFLRTAAGAAVGVAGGMLLANSISGMFAGGHGGGLGGGASPVTENITNNYYGSAPPAAQPTSDTQPQYDTSVADDGGYDGGGWDDGGGDSF